MDQLRTQSASRADEKIGIHCGQLDSPKGCLGVTCHADLHANNVIMTADGPRIIDWAASVRAGAALDLARFHVSFSDLVYAPEGTDPERPRALNAAVQAA